MIGYLFFTTLCTDEEINAKFVYLPIKIDLYCLGPTYSDKSASLSPFNVCQDLSVIKRMRPMVKFVHVRYNMIGLFFLQKKFSIEVPNTFWQSFCHTGKLVSRTISTLA